VEFAPPDCRHAVSAAVSQFPQESVLSPNLDRTKSGVIYTLGASWSELSWVFL